jgi:hypothetical protein
MRLSDGERDHVRAVEVSRAITEIDPNWGAYPQSKMALDDA